MSLFALVATVYFLAACLGLALRAAGSDVAVFWPASGFAAAILITFGTRSRAALVIGVVVGTVAASLMSDRGLLTSIFNGSWNAGEAVLAAGLLERRFGQSFTFCDLRRVAGFLLAGCLASAASAVGGAATMILLHPETTAPYWDVWREWFLSGWVGLVVVAPLVIGLAQTWLKPPSREEWSEGLGVLSLLVAACSYTMAQKSGSWLSFSPGAFVLPLLLWVTARCQPTFAIAGAFFASVAIICATTFGIGRFGDAAVPVMQRVTGAQLAMMTITLFTLVLTVLFAQRAEAEKSLAKERVMLARLHEVGSRLWRTRDLHHALDEILGGAIELLGADTGVIRLLDTAQEVLKVEAHRGLPQEFLDSFGVLRAAANSACGRALRSGERRVVDDVETDILYAPLRSFARTAGYRAAQATPIMSHEGLPLGLLSTHYRTPRRHTPRDLLLLDLYVRQAADIIERHKGEDALRESEERLRLAQLKTGISVWDRNLRTGKMTLTPELEALLGLEPGSMTCYADFRAQVHPDDIAAYEVARDEAVRRRATFEVEYRIIRPDGQVRWIVTRGGATYDELTGEPIRLVGNDADITERKLAEDMLAERNLQLDVAGRVGLVGSYTYDAQTDRLQISPGYAAIYGFPTGTTEITFGEWLGYVHPEDVDGLQARRSETFQERQEDYKADYRIVRRNGETRWIESRGVVLYGSDANAQRVTGVNIDVTERKRAELALVERNAQLALAGIAALVGSFGYDIDSGKMQVSDGYVAIHGLRPGVTETTRREWQDRVHPDDVERLNVLRNQALAERRREYYSEYRIVLTDRGVRWIESRSFISYDVKGNARRVVGVNIDVTERKLTELALAERDAQLALAAKAARVGCYANNLKTGLITVSDGYAAIHGLPEGTAQTTLGQWRTRVHPADLAPFDALREQLFSNRQRDYRFDYRIMRADGQIRWIESRGCVSYDENGQPQQCIGINFDITERKEAESALAERNAQLTLAGNLAGVGYFAYDVARRQRVAISDGYAAIYGWPEGTTQMTVDYWRTRVHPDDLAQFDQTRQRIFTNRSHDHSCDFRIFRADGQIRWIDSRRIISYDTAGIQDASSG